jgi:hypothetical protein
MGENRGMPGDVLTRRALNRATLARQLLLERHELPALAAVSHLVGLQAQVPRDPYLGLWSRLRAWRPEDLSELLASRQVVRIVAMRATIHLVSAADALLLRPLMQPVLDAELRRHREHAPHLRDVDVGPPLAFARSALAERPLSGAELRARLADEYPSLDAAALAYAARNLLPLVQVPPRGLWGRSGAVRLAPLETWVGAPVETAPSLDDVVLRYLAAFGPASVADVSAWSRLTGLRPVLERLRPRLVTFRDERGRELFDLPDAPRPDPATPAPVRFVPEYDNVLLSDSDRARFMPEPNRERLSPTISGLGHGAVLHDGEAVALWRVEEGRLAVRPGVRLPVRAAREIAAEGQGVLELLGVADGAVEVVA